MKNATNPEGPFVMRKNILLAFWMLSFGAGWSARAFTRDEVLLYVPFDGTVIPTVIHGGARPKIEGTFNFTHGVVGQAVTVGRKGTRLRYPTAGNIRPNEGTFSIWVQSLDWTLDEKVNRWWVDVPGPTRFIIYHYLHSNTVFFYHMDKNRRQPSIIKARTVWKPGQWKHLAGTWKNGRLRFYVNGIKVPEEARVELGELGKWIVLGAPGKGTADTNLDEFCVFSRALEDVEIRSLYRRGVHLPPAQLAISRIPPPKLDGVVDRNEYRNAVAVTGFCNRVTGLLDREQGTVYLGWDSRFLYLAHVWPVPEKVRLQPDNYSFGSVRKEARTRDGDIEADDVVGVEVRTGNKQSLRILANALGTVFDARNGDPKWNCGVRTAVRLDADVWTCEMALPLSELDLVPGAPGAALQLVRTHRLLRRDTVTWPGPNPADAAGIVLAPDAPPLQLTSVGQVQDGSLDVRVARSSGAPITITVTTDSGEVKSVLTLDDNTPTGQVRRLLTDTNLTRLRITAVCRKHCTLDLGLPVSYPPLLDALLHFYPSRNVAEIRLATRGAGTAAPVMASITRKGDTTPLRTLRQPGGRGDARVLSLPVDGLPPGDYRIGLTVGKGKTVLGRKTLPLTLREKPEWLGNRLGIIEYVPKPWTPLEYGADSVSCWGRRVELGDSLFPKQIVSQRAPLLASPVRLVAESAGKEQRANDVRFQWTRKDDQKGAWRTEAGLGPLSVRVSGSIEFDGMMWFEVALSARTAVRIDRVRLEIPMDRKHSTLFYSGNYRAIDTGATPVKRWHCAFRPCLGLSDEDRGLQWFAQSIHGWRLKDQGKAIELVPSDRANALVLNIVDSAVEIGPKARVFRFGLHPTPVKPPLVGRRRLRPYGNVEGKPASNLRLWWTNFGLGCSYPLPVNETGKKFTKTQHALGVKVMAYTRLCECSVKGPWYAYFRDEWRIDPGPRMAYKPDADWGSANPVCPGSKSWRDWTLWSVKNACEQLDFDGLYYDVSRPPSCMNQAHGCGFKDEFGHWQPEYQLLATRELQKRLWILLHEQLGGRMVTHHMSGNLYTVTQAFDDLIIDGENYTSMLKDNYYDLLPLDTFRAEYMGRQWGLTSVFLPEFSRAQLTSAGKKLWNSPAKLPEVRHLAGMIFLHDSIPWPAFSDLTPYYTIWAAQDALGWGDDVEFIPYWNNAEALDPLPEDIVVSIYRRNGRALLVLFNNTDADTKAKLRFHEAGRVKANGLRDFESKEVFPVARGAVEVPVKKRNFRLLLTE